MAEFKAAFFDLDGTLADNYTAIWKTVGAVFKERGLEVPSYDKVYRSVGGSILLTLEKLLPEGEKAAALDMGRRYMELCPLFVYDGLKPMPHARGILEALAKKGIKTACFTNKQTEAAEAVLEKLGLRELLDAVCATSLTSPRKPDREFGQAALEKLAVRAQESVFIGDSVYDWKSAENISAASALVATGADSGDSLRRNCPGALGVFASLAELSLGIFGVKLDNLE